MREGMSAELGNGPRRPPELFSRMTRARRLQHLDETMRLFEQRLAELGKLDNDKGAEAAPDATHPGLPRRLFTRLARYFFD